VYEGAHVPPVNDAQVEVAPFALADITALEDLCPCCLAARSRADA